MFLIFDLDGTLLDSRADLALAVNLTRLEYGLPELPPDMVAGFVGDGVRKLAERSLHGTGVDVEEALPKLKCNYLAHIHDNTTLYSGVEQGLRKLFSRGILLGLASNKPEQPCRVLLRHFGIEQLFSVVIGGDSVATLKPDPGQLLEAMRMAGAAPEESWMIGDHHTDIEAARRAGVRSVFMSYGIGNTGRETPEKTFSSFSELTDFLL